MHKHFSRFETLPASEIPFACTSDQWTNVTLVTLRRIASDIQVKNREITPSCPCETRHTACISNDLLNKMGEKLFKYHTHRCIYMVTTESEKKFHKQKAVDALERMKKAVDREDLKDANREGDTADHHLEEMAQLKSDEEDKS
jgi:phenolic acid decarboxylase